MILNISHETIYRYDHWVNHSIQCVRLTPPNLPGQKVLNWHLDLPAHAIASEDAYGNITHLLTLDYPHQEIYLHASGRVEILEGYEDVDNNLPPSIFLRTTELTTCDKSLRVFAETFRQASYNENDLHALSGAILMAMPFCTGVTNTHTTASEAFEIGGGVCQDHTHVFMACCRYLGLPARYVSGYIYSEGHINQPIATHAWAEVWLLGKWLGFDIVNQCLASDQHLRLAIGSDYLEACPVRGVRQGGGQENLQTQAWVHQQQHQQQQEQQ